MTDSHFICIKKHALGYNKPNRDTFVTMKHKIVYKGKLHRARDLVDGINITKVEKNKEDTFVYNILMDNYWGTVQANNLEVETVSSLNTGGGSAPHMVSKTSGRRMYFKTLPKEI